MPHTPGNWIASMGTNEYDLTIAEVFPIRMTIKVHPNPPGERWSCASGEEAEANARLIAAAPDLLAALKLARTKLPQLDALPKRTPTEIRRIVEVVEAAIRKAEGQEEE